MPDKITQLKQASAIYSMEHCRLFSGLPHEDLEQIAAFTTIQSLETSDYLFREGEPSQGFFLVQKGAVSVHRVNASGKEIVIHVFRSGESFAEGSITTERGYPADARALEPTQLLVVPKEAILSYLRQHPDLALRLLTSMERHLCALVQQIGDLTLRDVETRFLRWLIKRCPSPDSHQPHTFELPSTKQVLAAELGTVSATFSRTLAHLRDQDLIEVNGKSLTVLSPARLGAILHRRLED